MKTLSSNFIFPAGEYYIGDLCYVLSESQWEEYCEYCSDGIFQLDCGTIFALFSTAYGDGEYAGLSVDSGSIGCVLKSSITKFGSEELGRFVTFENQFKCYSEYNGASLWFGEVLIDTGGISNEPDWYEDRNEIGWYNCWF